MKMQNMLYLSGDTLFIGDVGRPDLFKSSTYDAGSIGRYFIQPLPKNHDVPDATIVYPAHGAGSACGKNMSKETVSTIGNQKRITPYVRI
jgi:glyoxylase-like metal-dependent hydrolase (beta-lactamase superfamily II)